MPATTALPAESRREREDEPGGPESVPNPAISFRPSSGPTIAPSTPRPFVRGRESGPDLQSAVHLRRCRTGKTHLLHAIGHQCCREAGYRVRYISAETFTNDLVMAIAPSKHPNFASATGRSTCRCSSTTSSLSPVKRETQDEFFHTFNDLHSHGQNIISSDRPPKSLATLEERLLSRFRVGTDGRRATPDEDAPRHPAG